MQIKYNCVENLPKLSWIAEVVGEIVTVTHGLWVEAREKFFVEGAWNGLFSDASFDSANWFCGTGGKVNDNSIIFSTPSHVTSGLFCYSVKSDTTSEKFVGGYIYPTVYHFCS